MGMGFTSGVKLFLCFVKASCESDQKDMILHDPNPTKGAKSVRRNSKKKVPYELWWLIFRVDHITARFDS